MMMPPGDCSDMMLNFITNKTVLTMVCQIPHSRAATIKAMKRNLTELLDEKVRIVKEKMGKKPFEALGISEEHYLRMKDTSKYTRLCVNLSCGHLLNVSRR